MKKSLKRLGLGALLAFSGATHAALIDNMDGTVSDTASGLMWTKNANINGLMNWATAVAWADGLTVGGHEDWRLPTTVQPDPSCGGQIDAGAFGLQGYGFNCTGSELGDLFYNALGVAANSSILTSALLQGADPIFTNVQSNVYWSGTEYAPDTLNAWYFRTGFGNQGIGGKSLSFYGWAVRADNAGGEGQAPLPGTLLLIGLGALGLRLARRRAC